MQLDGIHHIACIAADAPRNVAFHARVLGRRPVEKTVTFDALDVNFREPREALFELAAPSRASAIDEDCGHLREELHSPLQHEPLRERLERSLSRLENRRVAARRPS